MPLTNVDTKENVDGLSDPPRRKSSRMKNKVDKLKNGMYKDEVFRDDTVPDLENEGNSMGNSKILHSSVMKRRTIGSEGSLIQRPKMEAPRKRTPLVMETQNKRGIGNGREKVLVTRPGKRSTGKNGSTCSIINRKLRKSEENVLRTDSQKNRLIERNSSKAKSVEQAEDYIELSIEEQPTSENITNPSLSIAREAIVKIPQNMVKPENSDLNNVSPGDASFMLHADSLPLIPSGVILPNAPLRKACYESIATSPRPGDEAGGTRHRECNAIEGKTSDGTWRTVSMKDEGVGEKKSVPQALTIRKSVIASVKNGETFSGAIEYGATSQDGTTSKVSCQRSETKPTDEPHSFVKTITEPKTSMDVVSDESNETGGEDIGDFRTRRKKSEGQFGKLSELITNEQKEIIETLYTVNMGVVDDEEVYKNIRILDKMKIKCDICGKMYPRMDKCQVSLQSNSITFPKNTMFDNRNMLQK